MLCKSCGTHLPNDIIFCPVCGQNQTEKIIDTKTGNATPAPYHLTTSDSTPIQTSSHVIPIHKEEDFT